MDIGGGKDKVACECGEEDCAECQEQPGAEGGELDGMGEGKGRRNPNIIRGKCGGKWHIAKMVPVGTRKYLLGNVMLWVQWQRTFLARMPLGAEG